MSELATSLYLVPTPIGNLADITLRALDVLKTVDTILAEDTRTSGFLLKHYEISKPLQSFHIFNEHKTLAGLISRMQQGEVMALISDAGTPGISDPGFLLVREALKAGLKIDCLPGATALIPALVKSGFPTDRFAFEGFLPHKKGRQTMLKKLSEEDRTIVLYESPHRLIKTLEQLIAFFGPERLVSVSRELTKFHEETKTGTVTEVLEHFKQKDVKGEIVMVINGKEK
ncbi:MAG: 16S rRNA (cytidine(1402)-2'-O)-methyltransferase [Cyclobacteriaceae bacterium]|nr:16S rRNA (cytidine(1402)-2'-O)-methyltransferase [Cyclobacteriaceae bacterium]